MNYAFGYVLLTNFVITTISISTSISVFISNKSCKDVWNRPKTTLVLWHQVDCTNTTTIQRTIKQDATKLRLSNNRLHPMCCLRPSDRQTSSQLASSWWETCTSKERTGNLEKLALLSEANEKRDFQRTFRRSTCRKIMKKLQKHKRSTKNRSITCL